MNITNEINPVEERKRWHEIADNLLKEPQFMTHSETLKQELKTLEDIAAQLTSESGTIHMKQHFNKKRIKLLKEEIAEAEAIENPESSVQTLEKITEKEPDDH